MERGYDAVTVEDVVERAGVSRRTFFRYFPSKDAVFFADSHDRLERLREHLEQGVAAGDVWTAAREGLLGLAAEVQAQVDHQLAWRRALDTSPVLQARDLAVDAEYEAALRDAFDRSGMSTLRSRVVAGGMMGVARATLQHWYDADGTVDIVGLGVAALDALEEGFAPLVGEARAGRLRTGRGAA